MNIRFSKLSPNAKTPLRGNQIIVNIDINNININKNKPFTASSGAAGYDLFSAVACVIPSGECEVVKTDIRMEIPDTVYGRIAPRSGFAFSNMIGIGGGVVDSDYRDPTN